MPGEGGAAVRTLCNKLFAAGEYHEVEGEADCQLCRKRRDDPALVSSAFFEGDVGSQLLEMSLEQAQATRSRRQAGRSAGAQLRSAPGQARANKGERSQTPAEPRHQPEATVEKPSGIDDPDLANLSQVSDNVYRSPAGVVIRTRRRGTGGEVAEVVFDGNAQIKRNADGGVRIKLGDVIVEYSPGEGRLRARYRPDTTPDV